MCVNFMVYVPKVMLSNMDIRFTIKFWNVFHGLLGIRLATSIAFHPQTDGKIEQINRIIEVML